MKKRIILIVAIISLIAAGCSQPIEKSESAEKEQANQVGIEDFAFNPQEAKIKAGESVTWVNLDSAPHTVKFEGFESEMLGNGGKYERVFMEAGEHGYVCGIHPSMKGKVFVE